MIRCLAYAFICGNVKSIKEKFKYERDVVWCFEKRKRVVISLFWKGGKCLGLELVFLAVILVCEHIIWHSHTLVAELSLYMHIELSSCVVRKNLLEGVF